MLRPNVNYFLAIFLIFPSLDLCQHFEILGREVDTNSGRFWNQRTSVDVVIPPQEINEAKPILNNEEQPSATASPNPAPAPEVIYVDSNPVMSSGFWPDSAFVFNLRKKATQGTTQTVTPSIPNQANLEQVIFIHSPSGDIQKYSGNQFIHPPSDNGNTEQKTSIPPVIQELSPTTIEYEVLNGGEFNHHPTTPSSFSSTTAPIITTTEPQLSVDQVKEIQKILSNGWLGLDKYQSVLSAIYQTQANYNPSVAAREQQITYILPLPREDNK